MSTNIPPLFQQGEWVDLTHVEALRQVKAPFFYGRFGGAAALAARQMEHLVGLWIFTALMVIYLSVFIFG